jgi:hypothetical protein
VKQKISAEAILNAALIIAQRREAARRYGSCRPDTIAADYRLISRGEVDPSISVYLLVTRQLPLSSTASGVPGAFSEGKFAITSRSAGKLSKRD